MCKEFTDLARALSHLSKFSPLANYTKMINSASAEEKGRLIKETIRIFQDRRSICQYPGTMQI